MKKETLFKINKYVFPLNYDTWKESKDLVYENLDIDLKKHWLATQHSLHSLELPFLVLGLTILLIAMINSPSFLGTNFQIFLGITFIIMLIYIFLYVLKTIYFLERYINEKYMDLSKKRKGK